MKVRFRADFASFQLCLGKETVLKTQPFHSSKCDRLRQLTRTVFTAEDTRWGPAQDLASINVMHTMLTVEAPDLAVLNGDLITGEDVFVHNGTAYIDTIVAPFVERGIPWASTYGNHDSDVNLFRQDLLVRESRYSGSHTRSMASNCRAGISNYYLEVYSAHAADDHKGPEALLWFFDSRGGAYFQQHDHRGNPRRQANWVDASVVAWLEHTRDALTHRYSRTIPSLAFVHIPPAAVLQHQEDGIDSRCEPGINDDVPLAQQGQGWNDDRPSDDGNAYTGQDVPFMEALTRTEGLIAIFSGHDHGNDWCMKWARKPKARVADTSSNKHLCFGRRSGYGGYGTWMRGSRQVLLDRELLQHGVVKTWIRLEDESVSGNVTLNATYGHDRYKKAPNRHTHLYS